VAQKDFEQIKANVGVVVGDTSSSFNTKIGVWSNNRYRDIIDRLKSHNLFEVFRSITATTTANTSDYALPFDFDQAVTVQDQTNSRLLDVISEQEYLERFYNICTTSGTPIVMIQKSDSNVRVQPASSTTVKFASSSSSDTTQSGFIRGISGSAEFYETVTLQGTASAASSNSYDYILALGKDTATTGQVTVYYTGNSVTAAVLGPEQTEARYKRAGFFYIPAGTYDIAIRYKRLVSPMSQASDFPIIDISDGIEIGSIADAWRAKRQYGWAADHETLYERWLDRYIQDRISGMVHQADVTPYDREVY
jgi:hypothetical protein